MKQKNPKPDVRNITLESQDENYMNTFNPSGLQYLQILGGNQVIYEKSFLINLIFFPREKQAYKIIFGRTQPTKYNKEK